MLPFCVSINKIFFDYTNLHTVYNVILHVSIIGLIYIRFPNFSPLLFFSFLLVVVMSAVAKTQKGHNAGF